MHNERQTECRVHIHAPLPESATVQWDVCLDCGKRSPFARVFYDWYGSHDTCMRCGRQWSSGEWISLPFCRTARADSKQQARRSWKMARKYRGKIVTTTIEAADATA
jgi:hypothetical protein